jgi:hypothetical protein
MVLEESLDIVYMRNKSALSKKDIRMMLGLLMFFCFLFMVQIIVFFIELGDRLGSAYLVVLSVFLFHYLWVPCVCLIVLCYVLLTRVWKYGQ